MAPHWKCGLGQPIAGSNPALSATLRATGGSAHACVGASGPHSRTLGYARFGPRTPPSPGPPTRVATATLQNRERPHIPDDHAAAAQRVPVSGSGAGGAGRGCRRVCRSASGRDPAVRYRVWLRECGAGGCLPSGRATDRRGRWQPPASRSATSPKSSNCHLHADHAGQNAAFPGIPIYVQPVEWELAHTTDHTILEWIDFAGARYEQIAGDHQVAPGIRIVATPGHTVGHQSLVVDGPDGPIVLAGQALYTAGEWAGDPEALEGRSSARDQATYDRSIERLRRLDPAQVLFGHDRERWTA